VTDAVEESWRPVLGFEGWYEVSDLGRVRRIKSGRVLRRSHDRDGYPKVSLSRPGNKARHLRVHVIVADAFFGPRAPGIDVDHGNGVKTDCRLANLETVTHAENLRRARAMGSIKIPSAYRAASMLLAGRGSAGVS